MTDDMRSIAEELQKKNPQLRSVISFSEAQKLVHDLQVHQIELEMQNEELRRAQHELSDAHDAYVELYDFAPVAYLTLNQEGRIIEANFAAAALLGEDRGKLLVGRVFAGFVPRASLDEWEQYRRSVLETHEKHCMELSLQRPDGGMLTVLLESSSRTNSGRCLMALVDITDRKQTEQALGVERSLLRLFIEHAPAALAMFDRDMRYLSASNRWLEDYDLVGQELVGKSHYEVFPEIPDRWRILYQRGMDGEVLRAEEDFFERFDGRVQWQRWEIHPWRNAMGQVGGIAVFTEDITERKTAENKVLELNAELEQRVEERTAELMESEERFRIIFENAPDAHLLTDLEGRFIDGNKAVEWQIGYSREELIDQNMYEFGIFSEEGRAIAVKRIERLSKGEKLLPIEYHLRRKDGSEIPVEIYSLLIQIGGKPAVLNSSRDLTERKLSEHKLAESVIRFHELFERMGSGVAIYEAKNNGDDFIFKDLNAAGERISGIKRADVLGRGVLELLPSVKEMGLFEVFQQVWRSGEPSNYPLALYEDGQIQQWLENRVFRLPSGELVAIYDDHTAQKKAEQNLFKSEEKYRLVFESESDAIIILDDETYRVIDVNSAAIKLYGYSYEEFIELTRNGFSAEPSEPNHTPLETVDGRLSPSPYYLHRKKDGTLFPVEIKVGKFLLQERPVVCEVIHDITILREREQEILRKREELRKLTFELSLAEQRERQRLASELHDGVSQLLSSSYIRLGALMEASLPEASCEAVNTISDIVKEALTQVRSLTFELSCPMLRELGLVAALEELCSSMSSAYSTQFKFHGKLNSPPLTRDRQLVLYRSTRELLMNVMKHSKAAHAHVDMEQRGQSVRICVTDDGVGFDASRAGMGFSESGGFGLFNIGEYLRHAGGSLEIESTPGNGTQVILMVPLEEDHG